MHYRPEIDGLRAFAVIPVILFHSGLKIFGGGFIGVDIFFVISGYLITSIIIFELQKGVFSLINFYERRVRRIFPALFFVIFICVVFAWFWLLPEDMISFSKSLVAAPTLSSNILFWRESNYFESDAELKPLLHTWSLAVEEQYYLLFPIFMLFTWRLRRRWLLLILCMVFFSSMFFAQWGSLAKPAFAFYMLPMRGWEILIGAFIAFYCDKWGQMKNLPVCQLASMFGLLLIICSIFIYDKSTPFPSYYTLAPTIGAACIILFANAKTYVGWLLGSKPFVLTGLISYSAYLWHQPILAFAKYKIGNDLSFLKIIFLFALIFTLAYINWRYVEKPFREKKTFNRKKIFGYSLVIIFLFVTIGFFGQLYKGFEGRFESQFFGNLGDAGHFEFHQYLADKYFDCEPKSIASQAEIWEGMLRCKQSKKGIPQVILVGDSHAEHFFIGLAESIPALNVAFYIESGKPYLSNPQFKPIFNEILGNKKSQHVLLTFYYMERLKVGRSELYDELSITIQALLSAGKKVTLIGDVPKFRDPGNCKYESPLNSLSSCEISISEFERQAEFYRLTLKKLSSNHGITFIDAEAPLCSQFKCNMRDGINILYRDSNHLNVLGSKKIGSYIAEQLLINQGFFWHSQSP